MNQPLTIPPDLDVDSIAKLENIDGELVLTMQGTQLRIIEARFDYPEIPYTYYRGFGRIYEDFLGVPERITLETIPWRPRYVPPKKPKKRISTALGLRKPK